MIRFSICGAASYACGELLRLMVNHPETQVAHLADSFAAGQAIQNMNIIFGLDETTGLKIAPMYP